MEWLLLMGLAVIPGVGWAAWFYFMDRNKEPISLMARTFIAGMIAVVPVLALERPLQGVLDAATTVAGRLIAFIIIVGLVEEIAKYSAFRWAVGRHNSYDELMDGIVYAVTAALGFAAVENVLYGLTFGSGVVLLRGFVTTMVHASLSGIVGYYDAAVRFHQASVSTVMWALAGVSVVHGTYNLLITGGSVNPVWALVFVGGVYFYLIVKVQKARMVAD